jgi:hypothetical protein
MRPAASTDGRGQSDEAEDGKRANPTSRQAHEEIIPCDSPSRRSRGLRQLPKEREKGSLLVGEDQTLVSLSRVDLRLARAYEPKRMILFGRHSLATFSAMRRIASFAALSPFIASASAALPEGRTAAAEEIIQRSRRNALCPADARTNGEGDDSAHE